MLKKHEKECELPDGRKYKLVRPGRGGLGRIPRRIAGVVQTPFGPNDTLWDLDGTGVQAEALLQEYLTVAPDDSWKRVDGQYRRSGGETVQEWDLEDVDGEDFVAMATEVLAFHATFRHLDGQLRAPRSEEGGGEG